jgi:hypothetical protein
LTCNPFCRRIFCDVDPDEVSAVEPDDNKGKAAVTENLPSSLAFLTGSSVT